MTKARQLIEAIQQMPPECKPSEKNKKEADKAIEDAVTRGMPEPKQKKSSSNGKKKNVKSK